LNIGISNIENLIRIHFLKLIFSDFEIVI